MTLAVGRLLGIVSGEELGTVFAVTGRLALTAFHCVGDRHTGEVRWRRVRCRWGNQSVSSAVVQDCDWLNDVALLRLDRLLPGDLDPVLLVGEVTEHSPFIAPGAPAAVQDVFSFAISGAVAWTGGMMGDAGGPSLLQLACHESAAGLSLHGLSGAPVLIGQPQRAAGVIRWNSPREDRPELAAGGTVFAAPSAELLQRWPELASSSADQGIDLKALVGRLTNREGARTEAMVQADVRQLLIAGNLGHSRQDLAVPESAIADRHTIDVPRGSAIIVVKPDLRVSSEFHAAEQQLDRRVAANGRQTRRRYVGVVTDGVEWHLYQRIGAELQQMPTATFLLSAARPDVEGLLSWLEGVLASGQQVRPTPAEIERKLGARSPSYALDSVKLTAIYSKCRDLPVVKVKRQLWAKLLTTASGTGFDDGDALFVDHTLLVAMAEVIGHAVLGFQPENSETTAAAIMSGTSFSDAQISGVIEPDFFDWIAYVPGGEQFIKDLARRLTRFAWGQVEHDVMKVLYESIIPKAIRHRLGEYYTPDWLAEAIVTECVTDPLSQRVLDASCGSGTFLFHAVRRYVAHAEAEGMTDPAIISRVGEHVSGFDVHPVAVTLARVTYLLAIGMERLQAEERPGFAVPVYLGDSLRWGEERTLWSDEGLSIPTTLDPDTFVTDPVITSPAGLAQNLNFPDRVVADARNFDRLISTLAVKATDRKRGTPIPSLAAEFQRFAILEEDQPVLRQTFQNMCKLHDEDKDHIWGYYIRNLARSAWLARTPNQIDVLVGNPPWLAYRFMTPRQQASFRAMSIERGLWAGAAAATNQDLSALFVIRCIERYLRPGGQFGYVMPLATLSRRQYAGFRSGSYHVPSEPMKVAFDRPWDLHRVRPAFFKQSVGVIFGRRLSSDGNARTLNQRPELWTGRFATKTASLSQTEAHSSRNISEPLAPAERRSPYATRFFQGATLVPRFLFLTSPVTRPLGPGAGRRTVQSRRSPNEKKPWKDLAPLEGSIEYRFIYSLYLGQTILPFRCLTPLEAVIPWDGQYLLQGSDEQLDLYPGLAKWWRSAEAIWMQHRSSERMSLLERLDFQRNLSRQFSSADHRVVFNKSGQYLAAAVISDPSAIIDHKLIWGRMASHDEARFLTAILNSTVLTTAVSRLQGRGEHNPRDFDKHVFRFPIPTYDSSDATHQQLVTAAKQAEDVAANLTLPAKRFETQRRWVREALAKDGVTAEIDAIVKPLLT